MAGKTTTLTVQIVSDARKASAGFAEAESKVAGFQRGLDRASVAAGGVLAGMGAVALESFQAASSLQQSGGAIVSVFGDQAEAVEDMAKRAAQAVGLSQNSYQELASVIGSQLKNMGISHDQLVPKTADLISMGADLAATYGGDASEAVAALSSLLRGETDPIERYGVSIKQADINARLAALGLDELEGPAAKAAQAQAVLGLLTDQTSSSMGAFAREGDTASGAMQRASAEFENAKAQLGEALLPVVADGMEQLAGLSLFVQENSATMGALAIVVGGLALAVLTVNAAWRAYQAVMVIAAAGQWLLNTAMFANPIGVVILAVGALVAAFVVAYQKVEWFRDLIKDTWEWIQKAWSKVGGFITGGGSDGSGWSAAPSGGGSSFGGGGSSFGGGGSSFGGFGGGGFGVPMVMAPSGPSTVIQVSMDGLVVDGVATGRKLVQVLQEYAQATGGAVTVQVGSR